MTRSTPAKRFFVWPGLQARQRVAEEPGLKARPHEAYCHVIKYCLLMTRLLLELRDLLRFTEVERRRMVEFLEIPLHFVDILKPAGFGDGDFA
jgi:hypothetical protein